ncbi:MAG: hypothetical protein U0169_09655 [Polyangiaceae bacterium]
MRVVRVTESLRAAFTPGLRRLEAEAEYPLGDDAFRLDHGDDYFAFYDRMGDVAYYAAITGDTIAPTIVGVGCGVLRTVPDGRGGRRPAFYLADLKVAKSARGQRVPMRLMRHGFLRHYLACPRGFAVSMNPARGENRVVRLLQRFGSERFRWVSIDVGPVLRIHSLDAESMRRALPIVERHRGPTTFLSLLGKKDLVLRSTGKPLPLYHAQFGRSARAARIDGVSSFAPVEGATHMVMAPEGDALDTELRSLGFSTVTTATVVSHRMRDADFRFLLTSDV